MLYFSLFLIFFFFLVDVIYQKKGIIQLNALNVQNIQNVFHLYSLLHLITHLELFSFDLHSLFLIIFF